MKISHIIALIIGIVLISIPYIGFAHEPQGNDGIARAGIMFEEADTLLFAEVEFIRGNTSFIYGTKFDYSIITDGYGIVDHTFMFKNTFNQELEFYGEVGISPIHENNFIGAGFRRFYTK